MEEMNMNNINQLLTKDILISEFKKCGLSEGQTIIMHASLKSLGYVVGGSETILRVIFEIIGKEGTLIMPSQTWKNLDPETGVHWEIDQSKWDVIRDHWPAYDKNITPSIGMGSIAEMLRNWPNANRSDHPSRSLVAVGKYSNYIVSNHDLSNICGIGSPLDKIYNLDGYVLLLGVNHDKNTSLHLSEARANFSSKNFIVEHSAVLVNGKREWISYKTQNPDDSDFIKLGDEFEKIHNIKTYTIGNAKVKFISQPKLVDWAINWMENNR
jgi:aminoglycoside 3-N-acetyltransferase